MPGEERIFFDHFHKMAIALILIFTLLGIFLSEITTAQAIIRAVVFVSPMYALYFVYAKRFADVITLDFDARKARFSFHDDRGTFERNFKEIKRVNFYFYLTFVLDDARIMVKRPKNKKEIFKVLASALTVNRGIFPGL